MWLDVVCKRRVSKFFEDRRRQGMTEVGKQTDLAFTPEEYLNGEGIRKALPSSPSPEFLLVEQVEAKQREALLLRLPEAVARLPRKERAVFEASLHNETQKEAAKRVGLKEASAGEYASRARKKLLAYLSPKPPEAA